MARTRSALVLLCLLPACASPTNSSVSRTYPADQMAQMRDLKREQARFDAAKALPQKLEFAGQGQITITQLSLDGFPDNVYVRARWHYQNNATLASRGCVSLGTVRVRLNVDLHSF
jgi:hypothetical protein